LQVRLWPGAAQAIEDGVVLAEELGASGPDEVEASVQIGDWEMHPSPDADQAGLTQRVMETMALPL
jgi:hypothetical protein